MDKSQARRTYHSHRAPTSSLVRDDTNIVQQRIQQEWEKGCFWAAFAFVLLFGFMILGVILWNW